MKSSILILLIIFSSLVIANGQIFTQNMTNGSLTITPQGLQGKNNSGADNSNVALGPFALASYTSGLGLAANTAIGLQALRTNTTGYFNTAVGANALLSNTTGILNTATGLNALSSNTIGNANVAFGVQSLQYNTIGNNNTAHGSSALYSNTTGNSNTATGYQALYSNTTANNNTANGYQALFSNTTGNSNTATGYFTLQSNTTGISNTANGFQALYANTTGWYNTAIGTDALRFNTTGDLNTAMGNDALYANTTGYNNTATGTNALIANTTGVNNTSNGSNALKFNTTGNNNTAYGTYSGNAIIIGSNNTFLGNTANTTGDFSNATAIGYGALVNASNKVRIGDGNVTVIEGQVAWSNPSDRRLKENIVYTNRLGLDFINHLQTVSYNYISDKSKTRFDGFIAQDIEKVMHDLGISFSGLKKSTDGMYSLSYSDFVMPLVNAVQEQQKQIESLKMKLAEHYELKARIEKLEASFKAENSLQESTKK